MSNKTEATWHPNTGPLPISLASVWAAGARWGWEQSGEGWNDEIACGRPDYEPNFAAHNPHLNNTRHAVTET